MKDRIYVYKELIVHVAAIGDEDTQQGPVKHNKGLCFVSRLAGSPRRPPLAAT
jgi:hypothetical protein